MISRGGAEVAESDVFVRIARNPDGVRRPCAVRVAASAGTQTSATSAPPREPRKSLDARLSRSPWESRACRSRVAAERRGPTRRHLRSRGRSGTGTGQVLAKRIGGGASAKQRRVARFLCNACCTKYFRIAGSLRHLRRSNTPLVTPHSRCAHNRTNPDKYFIRNEYCGRSVSDCRAQCAPLPARAPCCDRVGRVCSRLAERLSGRSAGSNLRHDPFGKELRGDASRDACLRVKP